MPADNLRSYATLGTDRALPPADLFVENLFKGIEVQEAVLADFLQANAIKFVSPTGELRKQLSDGRQVYFTYDGHFSPDGHEVVAEKIKQYLQKK